MAMGGVLAAALALTACGASKSVRRIEASTTIDLSGRWNDADSRQVSQEVVADCLNQPWLTKHMTSRAGRKPVVIVGGIRNRSMEHIPVATFVKDIERSFVQSDRVTVVASAQERGELREERAEQQEFASPETIRRMGRERGADYMMTGEINTIEDREGGKQVVFYQVDLTLTNIETNEKVWIGGTKIKKFIERKRMGV
jgi:uncharacterized protein (TIGR02722 family)